MTETLVAPVASAAAHSRALVLARAVVWNAVLAGVYLGVAQLSLAAATEHRVVSSVWPPAGIALFALLRYGFWLGPGVFIGAFALNWTSGVGELAAGFIAFGDLLEGIVGAYFARRIMGERRALGRVRDVLALAGLAGLGSTLIAASVGVATLVFSGGTTAASAFSLWLVWWTGDALGVLVVTPFLLVWTTAESTPHVGGHRWVEAALTFLTTALVTDLVFGNAVPLVFSIYPVGIWIAWRFGPRGAATATAVVTLVAAWRTLSGYGPFTSQTPTENLFALQLFLSLFAVKALLFAAVRTEAVTSDARLRVSETRYRQLAQNLPDGCVVLFDAGLRILLAEGPALLRAGFTKAQAEGKRLADVFDEQHAAELGAHFREASRGNDVEFEFAYNTHTFLVRVLPIRDTSSDEQLAMALLLDVTEREATRREIVESRAQFERLSQLLLTAQEDERRRVAREVHDELGQALTAVKIGLSQTLTRVQRRSSLESEKRIANASDLLDRAIASVQRIVLRLRPGVLDNLGPLAALEYEVQQFREQSGIEISLQLPPEPLVIDAEQSTALYRTVQEALTNVIRHAEAQRVTITLMATDHELLLQVADDGRGIAEAQLLKPRSMGILGMRERAASCGGRLDIYRVGSGGTCLSLRMPRHSKGQHVA